MHNYSQHGYESTRTNFSQPHRRGRARSNYEHALTVTPQAPRARRNTNRTAVRTSRGWKDLERIPEIAMIANDWRNGSLRGTSFGKSSPFSVCAAGAIYTLVAAITLFIGV